MFKELIAKIIAGNIARGLDLKEGPMEDKKQWYKSKTVLAAIAGIVINAYEGVAMGLAPQFGWTLPPISPIVLTVLNGILGPIVIHGRVTANTKLTA